jgi:Holliday junction resolvase
MPRNKYQLGAQQERDDLKRYRDSGCNTIRGAGSKSSVRGLDGIAWDQTNIYFVFSRYTTGSHIWTDDDIVQALKDLKMPNNGIAIFFSKRIDGERAIVYTHEEATLLLAATK